MDIAVGVFETAAQPVLSVRTVTPVGNLPQEIGKAYGAIMEYLGECKAYPADMPFVAYYNMDMERLDVEIGFPVANALPGKDGITASEIPAGKKAASMYKGPYMEMAPAYEAMTKWMEENGYQPAGVVYEFYYNSPMEVPESELLTKIVFLLK
ncbi:MAG: GyrI-like domain-containing protein [Bacillota bacterium]